MLFVRIVTRQGSIWLIVQLHLVVACRVKDILVVSVEIQTLAPKPAGNDNSLQLWLDCGCSERPVDCTLADKAT